MAKRKILGIIILLVGAFIAAVILNQQVMDSAWNGFASALQNAVQNVATGTRRNGGAVVEPHFAVANQAGRPDTKPDLSNASLERAGTVFSVVEAAATVPHFIQVNIDPVAVLPGEKQTLTAVIEDPNPITSVVAVTRLDHGTTTLPLKLQGPASASALLPVRYDVAANGVLAILPQPMSPLALLAEHAAAGVADAASSPQTYQAGWTVADTHNTTYVTEFIAKDSAGNVNAVTFAWSDACGIPNGGNWTGSSCTLSATDGVDNGSASIGSGVTLNLNGHMFAFNGGSVGYISLSGGSITIGTGKLVKSNIYVLDSDGDNYAAEAVSTYGWPLQSDSSGPPDPNGGYMCFYNGTAVQSCYSTSNGPRRYNFSGGFGDCNDSNANVNPGQTAYFTAATTTNMNLTTGLYDGGGEVNFDYNCDGVETKSVSSYDYGCVFSGSASCNGSSCGSGACGVNTAGNTTPACGNSYTYTTACPFQDSSYYCDAGKILCTTPSGCTNDTANAITSCH